MPHFGTLTNSRKPAPVKLVTNEVIAPPVKASSDIYQIEEQRQGGITLPMIMATILVFMHFGRPFDTFLMGYHLPMIIGSVGIVVMFFTRWTDSLRTRIGIPLVLFVCVMAAACVTSVWRGGSATYVYQYALLNVVFFLLIGSAPTTLGQVRFLAVAVIFSSIFNFAVGAHLDENGRLLLENAMLGNSDDVALCGGFCIPIFILWAKRLGKVLGTLVGVAGVAACLIAIEMSGTRFALVSLAVMGVVYFFKSAGVQRVGLAICFVFIVIGSLMFLPKAIVSRFATIGSVFGQEEIQAGDSLEAIQSTKERQQLIHDGFTAFFSNPLLGVGPNVFIDWRWETMGKHGQPTHNTYLQVAAEEGIFALVFYVAFLVGAVVTFRKCVKSFPGWEEGSELASGLEISLVYFMTSAFTLTCVAHMHQFFIVGLAVALDRLRLAKLAALEAGTPQIASSPKHSRESKFAPLDSFPSAPPRSKGDSIPIAPARSPRYRFNRPVASTSRND